MYDTFSNHPYEYNFKLYIPVGTILNIWEQHKEEMGEDLYFESLTMASFHSTTNTPKHTLKYFLIK